MQSWRTGRELAASYQRCHVVLLPSEPTYTWTEQFGRVIVEAQASGAVVAGFATGAIPEVAGRPALLADAGDTERLTESVDALLAEPDQLTSRRAAGVHCRERTWSRVAERQARLYEAALGSGVSVAPQPRSPAARRVLAELEFGLPAVAAGGARPFALPVLRRGGVFSSALGRAIDFGRGPKRSSYPREAESAPARATDGAGRPVQHFFERLGLVTPGRERLVAVVQPRVRQHFLDAFSELVARCDRRGCPHARESQRQALPPWAVAMQDTRMP